MRAQHYAGTNRIGRETCRLYSKWHYLAVAELAGCRGFEIFDDGITATFQLLNLCETSSVYLTMAPSSSDLRNKWTYFLFHIDEL